MVAEARRVSDPLERLVDLGGRRPQPDQSRDGEHADDGEEPDEDVASALAHLDDPVIAVRVTVTHVAKLTGGPV